MLGVLSLKAQYNPSLHSATNKPLGIAQAVPTDARTWYFDSGTFTYRPYSSRAEILAYLNLAKYRSGQFDIIMDSAGQRYVLYFRNGTADTDLTFKIPVGNYLVNAKNGVKKNGDTLKWGGLLTENTQIQVVNKKYSGPFRYISISNSDSANDYYYSGLGTSPGDTIYDRANIYVSRGFGDSATAQRQYGGAAQFQTRNTFNTTNKAFMSSSTPYFWSYGGAYGISQYFPPDTSFVRSSPYGATGSAFAGDFGIGQSSKYRIDVVSSPNIPYYPLAVYRSGVDYARSSDAFKREVYGNGMVNFVADWRSQQGAINSGTTEYGSYIQRHIGFLGYGTIIPHTSSPSKAKTLAVSKVDTFAHFWARPAYTNFNEVANGYGYVQEGTLDYNWMQGFSKFGGTMPGTATAQTHQVHIDSTLMVGKPYTSTSYMTLYNMQSGITSMSGKYIRGLAALNEYSFDANTSIATSFMSAGDFRLSLSAGSAQNAASNNSGVGANGLVGRVLLRKKAGYTGITTFEGGTTINTSLAAIAATFDLSGVSTSGNENIGSGWFTGIRSDVLLSSFNRFHNFVWLQTGGGQLNSTNAFIDTGYQIYMRPHNTTTVVTKYALYQAGSADSNYLAGPTRFPNVITQSIDTTTYKPAVLDGNGNLTRMYWPTTGGGGSVSSVSNSNGSLTISPTTGAVVASLNLSNANTWAALQTYNNGVRLNNILLGTSAMKILMKGNDSSVYAIPGSTFATPQQISDSLDANTVTFDNPNLGDTLLRPISTSVLQVKSLIAGTGVTFNVNDSTITINASGGGDLSSNVSSSTVNQLPVFADGTGKLLTAFSGNGILSATGGVISTYFTTGSGFSVVLSSSPTIVTPTIASFTNATHNHTNAAGGGTLPEGALALTDITTNNVSTSAHGFMPKLPNTAGTYGFDGVTGAYVSVTGGGGLGDPGSNGIVARTALNTTAARTLTGTTNRIVITNGTGVSGDPTFDIGTDVVTLTGSQTMTNKTLTSPNIAALNGGTAANDDIRIQGTTNATRTTSYVTLQENGGFVGIGTASPNRHLHVVKNDGTFNATARIEDQNTTGYTMYSFVGTGREFTNGVGNASEVTFGVANKYFWYDQTANAMRAVIDQNGYFGVGTTSPTALISVAASNTTRASINMASGSAPTSPNNGDMWQATNNLFMRLNGVSTQISNNNLYSLDGTITGKRTVSAGNTSSQVSWKLGTILNEVNATDANYTLNVSDISVELPTITADRNITFTTTAADSGKIFVLNNTNNTSFKWNLSGWSITTAGGYSIAALENTTVYTIMYCGTNAGWKLLAVSGNPPTYVSSSGTVTLNWSIVPEVQYVGSGTTATYTLPNISSASNRTGFVIGISNRGSGAITVNSNGGANDIWDTAAVNTYSISAGGYKEFFWDGTYFKVR